MGGLTRSSVKSVWEVFGWGDRLGLQNWCNIAQSQGDANRVFQKTDGDCCEDGATYDDSLCAGLWRNAEVIESSQQKYGADILS
jgi:hypothetical protein